MSTSYGPNSDAYCSHCGQERHAAAPLNGCFVALGMRVKELERKIRRPWYGNEPSLVLYDLSHDEAEMVFGFVKGMKAARK